MELASRLRADAAQADERRVLVLAGPPATTRDHAADALQITEIEPTEAIYVGSVETVPATRIAPRDSASLLGTTQQAVVVDCHDRCEPNALARAVGAVDGGGLLILLTPPLEDWPTVTDSFDETLAVPPADVDAVTGLFRQRLVDTLRGHRGIAIVDVDADMVLKEGILDKPPRPALSPVRPPDESAFPTAVYDHCLTTDQAKVVSELERLRGDDQAIVVEADRGRGKSSAAGLAAAALAVDGHDVLITAPRYRNAAAVFERADELLTDLGELSGRDQVDQPCIIATETGRVRFSPATTAMTLPDNPDCVIVDEAAALPVRLLEQYLAADSVAFTTTIHGYEGAGRGFSVRFRDRLTASRHEVTDVSLSEPIRYAPGDPVEVWSFRAFCLGARPPVDQLVADATPETVTYHNLSAEDLLADEHLLREVFGLLILAHYRTEPNDLARLLDAPNISVRALCQDGHVVSVALLAREGSLSKSLRARMYEGERVRGNMIPDVLTSQLRDEAAGETAGWRVLRIATHHSVRSRGLGSTLLAEIRGEAATQLDWLGVGYGATPELVSFWRANGFSTVHLSTTRNDRSGEHSAVMLDPLSGDGKALQERHSRWLLTRLPTSLSDTLSDVDSDVIRAVLRSVDAEFSLSLSDWEWRVAAGVTTGMAILATAPRPIAQLTLRYFVGDEEYPDLDPRLERLLVGRVLQHQPWTKVAKELDFDTEAACKRTLSDAVRPLVRAYGGDTARAELERFQ